MNEPVKKVQHELNEELKKTFPHKRVAVDALRGKERGQLRVHWTNGPSAKNVHDVCKKYEERTVGINEFRHMTNAAKELALSILVENNRKVRLTIKGNRLNPDLDKETIAGLSGGMYALDAPSSLTDAIRQVFNQMDF